MTKTKSKKKTIILCVVLAVVIALLAILGVRIIKNSSWAYTEEQHLQRISELVEKRYTSDKYDYTSYKIFPLYDQNEKMKHCLVEFEPYGFVWVRVNSRDMGFIALHSMYTRCEPVEYPWSRYEYINTTQTSYSEENIKWETDEFGERIYYKDSPYKVADIKDEKRYLVTTNQANDEITIPAVKRGDKYLNLMDMKEFEYVAESETYKYPYFLTYFPSKPFFNL